MEETIRGLSCVQLDSITAVERSHRIAIGSRVGAYPRDTVSRLLGRGRIFEYWAHEACLVPIEDYPFFKRRMEHLRERHWWGREHDHDPELKERVLDNPAVMRSAISLWNALRQALTSSLADPHGAVRTRMLVEVEAFSARLASDAALRARLDGLAADAAVFVVDRYGAEVTTVITHTIERWDGREAARRIELHVGRDLQFIRINGTIVGGLVGVLIHTVTVLIG